jgi:hypothetical protein
MTDLRNAYNILVRKPEGKRQLGRVDERIILKWILKKWGVKIWMD